MVCGVCPNPEQDSTDAYGGSWRGPYQPGTANSQVRCLCKLTSPLLHIFCFAVILCWMLSDVTLQVEVYSKDKYGLKHVSVLGCVWGGVSDGPAVFLPPCVVSCIRPCSWTNYLTGAPTIYITQNLRPNPFIHVSAPEPPPSTSPNAGSLSVCPGHREAGLGFGAVPGPTWCSGASSAFSIS